MKIQCFACKQCGNRLKTTVSEVLIGMDYTVELDCSCGYTAHYQEHEQDTPIEGLNVPFEGEEVDSYLWRTKYESLKNSVQQIALEIMDILNKDDGLRFDDETTWEHLVEGISLLIDPNDTTSKILYTTQKEKDKLLYGLARLMRNTDGLHPSTWGPMVGNILMRLRTIDGEKYDKECIQKKDS